MPARSHGSRPSVLALLDWLDPNTIVARGGLLLVAAIVFAESGLVLGIFLPGDSLLFIAGFLSSDAGGGLLPSILIVVPAIVMAAFAGDQVGYVIGRRAGRSLSTRPKSRTFDPEWVERADRFFDRHGATTVVLARFVPIVRTLAPVLAGAGRMRYRTFVAYNLVGALLWGAGVTLLGFWLGSVDLVRDHVELAAVGVVAVSLVPAIVELARHRSTR